jgi:hypothetical protein
MMFVDGESPRLKRRARCGSACSPSIGSTRWLCALVGGSRSADAERGRRVLLLCFPTVRLGSQRDITSALEHVCLRWMNGRDHADAVLRRAVSFRRGLHPTRIRHAGELDPQWTRNRPRGMVMSWSGSTGRAVGPGGRLASDVGKGKTSPSWHWQSYARPPSLWLRRRL